MVGEIIAYMRNKPQIEAGENKKQKYRLPPEGIKAPDIFFSMQLN